MLLYLFSPPNANVYLNIDLIEALLFWCVDRVDRRHKKGRYFQNYRWALDRGGGCGGARFINEVEIHIFI